jgi:hypothetical protein
LSGYYANVPGLPGAGGLGGHNGPHGGYHDQHMPPPGGGSAGPQVPGRGGGGTPGTPGSGLPTPDQRALSSTVNNFQPGQNSPSGGGGGGGGFKVGGGLIGMAEGAAAAAAGPAAPGVQAGMQLANLAASQIGKYAAIGVEGLFETFGLNDSAVGDPSKSLLGKLALGFAGAKPASPNTAGNTQPPLKPDDSKNQDHKGTGAPPGPMINIEHQHIDNSNNNGSVERDMNRVLIGQGVR